MTLRRRSRILLASFALTAPLMLGGCSATYCEEPAGDSLEPDGYEYEASPSLASHAERERPACGSA